MAQILKLPSLEFNFYQKYKAFIEKTKIGRIILIVADDKLKGTDYKELPNITEAKKLKDSMEEENYKRLLECYTYNQDNFIYLFRMDRKTPVSNPPALTPIVDDGALGDLLDLVEDRCKQGWIIFPQSNDASLDVLICDFIRSQMKTNRHYRFLAARLGLVNGSDQGDNPHIANLWNESFTMTDGTTRTTNQMLAIVASMIANANTNRTITNQVVAGVARVKESKDEAVDNDAGRLLMYNDEDVVRVRLERNTFTGKSPLGQNYVTNNNWQVDTVGLISCIEATDVIMSDISRVFLEEYSQKGKKNTLANQLSFISAVNDYFKMLGKDETLDPTYNNIVTIDVQAQRDAWVAAGKTEVKDWTDAQVINTPFKRTLFMAGDIKIAQGLDSFKFNINLF